MADRPVVGGEASRRGRETKAARLARGAAEREAQEALVAAAAAVDDLVRVGEARAKGKPYSWGPDGEGRFLAGAECRDCGDEFVGSWSRGLEDGVGAARYQPHRDAAARSLYQVLGRHVCSRPKEER